MATTEEIEHRVAEADAARSVKRSAAAQRIGDLAQRRAAIAEQLREVERELGEVLAEAADVIEIDELARFTDVPAADLTRWLGSRESRRPKRNKPKAAGLSGAPSSTRQGLSTEDAPAMGRTSTRTTPPMPGDGTADTPEPVTAEVR